MGLADETDTDGGTSPPLVEATAFASACATVCAGEGACPPPLFIGRPNTPAELGAEPAGVNELSSCAVVFLKRSNSSALRL